MKRVQRTKTKLLQVSPDKSTYRILLPKDHVKLLQQRLGRDLEQSEPWDITLLDGEPGFKCVPVKK